MKIEIDTVKDTNEEIRHIIRMLENILKERGVFPTGVDYVKIEEKPPMAARKSKDADIDEEEEVKRRLRFEII